MATSLVIPTQAGVAAARRSQARPVEEFGVAVQMSSDHYSRLWSVLLGPLVWLLHFVVTYVTVASWCARHAPHEGLGPITQALQIFTALTLAAELGVAWHGFRVHGHGFAIDPVSNTASTEDRERFLAFATWLLAGLSLAGTVYVALPLWFVAYCR